MPYNLKIMMNNLKFKCKMHTSSNFHLINIVSTDPNIFKIAKNAVQNFNKLKFKIIIYQNNLLNQIYNLIVI